MATIGVPKEIKQGETRVSLTPDVIRRLVALEHSVVVEVDAGFKSGISTDDYAKAGAEIIKSAHEVYARADFIVKVKEPQQSEWGLLNRRHTLFCYLHLAANRNLTIALMKSGCRALAYETLQALDGSTPLLSPMSDIAGRVGVQRGITFLPKLLSGIPGVPKAHVMIVGAGIVGRSAMHTALGLGARVTLADINVGALKNVPEQVSTFQVPFLEPGDVRDVDVLVGAVHVRGQKAIQVASKKVIQAMQPRSLVIDVSIDQGGCFESSKATSHGSPTYNFGAITHYCVPNLPAAVPHTATRALVNATEKYVMLIAESFGLGGEPLDERLHSANNIEHGGYINRSIITEFPDL